MENEIMYNFLFSIVRIPYLCSNIPSKKFYSPFEAEILRRARTASIYCEIRTCFKALLNRAQNQSGNVVTLKTITTYNSLCIYQISNPFI